MCRAERALAVLALLAAAAPLRAQEAEGEDFTRWSHYHELPRPAGKAFGDFLLTPSVFGTASPALEDLRLADESGKAIPYALRVRRPSVERRELPGRAFDRGTKADHSSELTLDLENPPEYDRVEIDVQPAGPAYSRRLLVEGSADGKEWAKALEARAVDVTLDGGQRIERREFPLPPTRHRFVRVRVWPDRVIEDDRPKLTAARVYRTETVKGETVTRDAFVSKRMPTRHAGQYASAWDLDLGEANVPVSRLTLTVKDGGFTRPFDVVIPGKGGRSVYSGGGMDEKGMPWAVGSDSPTGVSVKGEKAEVWFPEVQARRLRLIVIDSRNAPLNVENASYSAAARQVIFAVPAGSKGPMRLYSGNERATPPNYVLAGQLPLKMEPGRVSLDERQSNPDYVAPPRPWTERWPYLADVALGAACVLLGGLLAALARGAVRRHDALPEAAEVNSGGAVVPRPGEP